MLERFIQNKEAVEKISLEDDGFPNILNSEWETMQSLLKVLRPIHKVTIDLQKRRSSIANVIPVKKALLHALKFPVSSQDGDLIRVRAAIANGIETRMLKFEEKRFLVVATILDPRYKLRFFEPEESKKYRGWIEEESGNFFGNDEADEPEDETPPVPDTPSTSSGIDEIIGGYLQHKYQNEAPTVAATIKEIILETTKAKIELVEYLDEPPIPQNSDPYDYWKNQQKKRPHLAQLVKKFHSPPVGSQESERLFSTAGYIVNDLRKSLSPQNLEMLLYVHHNLPLYEYK